MIKVLIVEDDPMVAYLNERFLSQIPPYKIVGKASNGEEALAILEKTPCDLVILDVYMPKLDGLELLKIIRQRFLSLDVIFVTAAKENDVIDQALKLGAVDYLVKPFEFDRLKLALDNYTKRHQLMVSSETISQKDIDRLTKTGLDERVALPKGLQQKTLERVMTVFNEDPEDYLSAEEIAEKIGISRVTVRRYLEYQESVGALVVEVKYGSVGRPSYVYRVLK